MTLHEHRAYLLRLLRSWVHGQDPPLKPFRSASPEQWDRLAAEAQAQQVAPILHNVLQQAGAPEPAVVRDRLHRCYRESAIKTGAAFLQLEEFLAAMSREGMRLPILLKGMALGPLLYSSIALRPVRDIDLLVRGEDRQAIGELARTLGYTLEPLTAPTSWHAEILRAEATEESYLPGDRAIGLKLDVHTEPIPGVEIGSQRIRDAAEETTLGSIRALVPRPEHLLLLLVLHIVSHRAGSGPPPCLLWWLDVALFVSRCHGQMDWDEFVRASAPVPEAVAVLAADCLATAEAAFALEEIPQGVAEALSRGAEPRSDLDMLEKTGEVDLRNARVVMARSPRLASLLARLRWVAGYVFPRAGYVRAKYAIDTRSGLLCWYARRPATGVLALARSLRRQRR